MTRNVLNSDFGGHIAIDNFGSSNMLWWIVLDAAGDGHCELYGDTCVCLQQLEYQRLFECVLLAHSVRIPHAGAVGKRGERIVAERSALCGTERRRHLCVGLRANCLHASDRRARNAISFCTRSVILSCGHQHSGTRCVRSGLVQVVRYDLAQGKLQNLNMLMFTQDMCSIWCTRRSCHTTRWTRWQWARASALRCSAHSL